jgi:hypothetical protein
MAISVKQLHPVFVGEVGGVDLREALGRATVDALHDAINQYSRGSCPRMPGRSAAWKRACC